MIHPRTIDNHSYPIIIEKLELDLNVRSQLLKLYFLFIEPELCLCQPKLVDLCISGLFVVLQVSPVGIILYPGDLVHLDSGQRVLHGLVDNCVDGAHEEVEGGQELLSIFGEISLSFCIVEKLLLQLWRLVSKVRETFSKRILKSDINNAICISNIIYLPVSGPC